MALKCVQQFQNRLRFYRHCHWSTLKFIINRSPLQLRRVLFIVLRHVINYLQQKLLYCIINIANYSGSTWFVFRASYHSVVWRWVCVRTKTQISTSLKFQVSFFLNCMYFSTNRKQFIKNYVCYCWQCAFVVF